MRTTLNIDDAVLRELKRLQKLEGKPLGQCASELLARALADRRQSKPAPKFRWKSSSMRARVDLDDKEALYRAMDRGE